MSCRRFARLLAVLLTLAGWGAGLFAPIAEARAAVPSAVTGLHVEAPGDNPAHAVHDHDACAWCAQLRIAAEPASAQPALAFSRVAIIPAVDRAHALSSAPSTVRGARAPPVLR